MLPILHSLRVKRAEVVNQGSRGMSSIVAAVVRELSLYIITLNESCDKL